MQNQWGYLELSESYQVRLAWTPSLLTQPLQRYSTSNNAGASNVKNFNNFYWLPAVDCLGIVSDAFPAFNLKQRRYYRLLV